MLMTGNIPPYYTDDDIKQDIRNMHINIETLILEYYKTNKMKNDPLWVKVSDLFMGHIRLRDIISKLEEINEGERIPREEENLIDDNIEKVRSIKERDFLEQVIPVNATIREAIDIFYIVNSSGVNLTEAELALAHISGYWPKAREIFKKRLEGMKEKGWVFNLDFIIYVLLAVVHRQGSKMEKLHDPSNKENVQEAWKLLDDRVLDFSLNLMKSQAYIDHTKEINSVYALVPIITYVYLHRPRGLNETEINALVKWFYYSQIRTRYTSQLPQKLDKDLKIVERSNKPFEELLQLIAEERPLEVKASEFEGKGVSHPLLSLMRWYFKSINAVCLGTGLTLRKNMGSKYELERDHIFAYSLLRDSEYFDMASSYDYTMAQEMANRAILTAGENGSKSARNPFTYLSDVQERLPNALKLQCIPEDKELWNVKNYERFLEARRELLAGKLNAYLENISITQTTVKVEIDLLDIIQSGEHVLMEFKSSLRWNVRESRIDKRLEAVVMKCIAAFNNSEGGKLLIGVSDDGDILGLDEDYNTLSEANKDKFELHLRNLISSSFGKDFTVTNIKIDFPVLDEEEICQVEIKKGTAPMFLDVVGKSGQKHKRFYVRSGNSSQELGIAEVASYINERFRP